MFDEYCVFCDISVNQRSLIEHWTADSFFLKPLNPVTPGHMLAIPKIHVYHAMEDQNVTAQTMRDAIVFANYEMSDPDQFSFNFITSVGKLATQSVFHLHIHIIPRREGDGLHLPWTSQIV